MTGTIVYRFRFVKPDEVPGLTEEEKNTIADGLFINPESNLYSKLSKVYELTENHLKSLTELQFYAQMNPDANVVHTWLPIDQSTEEWRKDSGTEIYMSEELMDDIMFYLNTCPLTITEDENLKEDVEKKTEVAKESTKEAPPKPFTDEEKAVVERLKNKPFKLLAYTYLVLWIGSDRFLSLICSAINSLQYNCNTINESRKVFGLPLLDDAAEKELSEKISKQIDDNINSLVEKDDQKAVTSSSSTGTQ
jgi:hypothetical protein